MKSHNPAAHVPARIDVPEGRMVNTPANASKIRQKRGRPVGAKDTAPRKRRTPGEKGEMINPEDSSPLKNTIETVEPTNVGECTISTEVDEQLVPEETEVPNNEEIFVNYTFTARFGTEMKLS